MANRCYTTDTITRATDPQTFFDNPFPSVLISVQNWQSSRQSSQPPPQPRVPHHETGVKVGISKWMLTFRNCYWIQTAFVAKRRTLHFPTTVFGQVCTTGTKKPASGVWHQENNWAVKGLMQHKSCECKITIQHTLSYLAGYADSKHCTFHASGHESHIFLSF